MGFFNQSGIINNPAAIVPRASSPCNQNTLIGIDGSEAKTRIEKSKAEIMKIDKKNQKNGNLISFEISVSSAVSIILDVKKSPLEKTNKI